MPTEKGLKRLRRLLALAATISTYLVVVTAASGGHGLELLDHPAPGFAPTVPPAQVANQSPLTAWQFVATIPTGNPHSDLDFFTQRGETFASVGTLGIGANGGGQTIVKLTEGGEIAPSFVSSAPTASCVTDASASESRPSCVDGSQSSRARAGPPDARR